MGSKTTIEVILLGRKIDMRGMEREKDQKVH